MIAWVQAERGHFRDLEVQPAQVGEADPEALEAAAEESDDLLKYARSCIADGRVLGIAGCQPLWKGVGQAWGLFSMELRCHPLFLVRGLNRLVDEAFHMEQLHRIQTSVRVGFLPGLRLMQALDFVCEGRMFGYGPAGEDYDLFARLKPLCPA